MKTQNSIVLKNNGFRVTKSRLAILDFFDSATIPLDVESILAHLQSVKVAVNITTVYRFLNAFVHAGIMHRIELGEGKYRYELASTPHHHHLICNRCGDIQDVVINEEQLMHNLPTNSGFRVDHHHLEFFGMCAQCK